MGRVTFDSPEVWLKVTPSEAYAFLSNLDNMEKLMPEQVINWKSGETSCSFDIKGMAHIDLVIGERRENELIAIDSGPDNPINTQIQFLISGDRSGGSITRVHLNAELSMMLELLASTPLQNLVNIMAEKLNEVFSG